MATNNAVNVGLAGSTGTGNFVGANTPTLITPVIGAATGTSLAFSPTTGGIIGTTTNDNAAAGKVGEFVSSVIADASAVSISSATNTNLTTISLTAGDWDVWGNVNFGTVTVGSSFMAAWISSTSAALPDNSLFSGLNSATGTIGSQSGITAPLVRFSLAGTTTIYISARINLTGGTANMCGGIYARRRR